MVRHAGLVDGAASPSYYLQTGNAKAKAVLDKWVPWAIANTTIGTNWSIPSTLTWTRPAGHLEPEQPGSPTPACTSRSPCKGQDVGVAGRLRPDADRVRGQVRQHGGQDHGQGPARRLSAASDAKGVSVTETRGDYKRFDDVYDAATGQGLYVPPGWTGKMPNGDAIAAGKTFLDIRSFYKNDPDWPKVQAYLNGGPEPTFNYHRFWAQADVAMAYADYGTLFPNG